MAKKYLIQEPGRGAVATDSTGYAQAGKGRTMIDPETSKPDTARVPKSRFKRAGTKLK